MEVIIIGVALVIFSIILHEVAHGYMAHALGDPTARFEGRLTLNPVPHIDPVGSVLVPGILALSGTPFLIGWAKPVPYNPYNLRYGKWGEALVAFAGPATNIALALLGALAMRAGLFSSSPALFEIGVLVIIANLVLAIINLIPIPPLDGSKIIKALLPARMAFAYSRLEQATYALGPFGLIGILIVFVLVFSQPISALVFGLFRILVGL
jgi:Zn-dependent protease